MRAVGAPDGEGETVVVQHTKIVIARGGDGDVAPDVSGIVFLSGVARAKERWHAGVTPCAAMDLVEPIVTGIDAVHDAIGAANESRIAGCHGERHVGVFKTGDTTVLLAEGTWSLPVILNLDPMAVGAVAAGECAGKNGIKRNRCRLCCGMQEECN